MRGSLPGLQVDLLTMTANVAQVLGDARISVGVPHSGMGRSSTICFMTSVEVMR